VVERFPFETSEILWPRLRHTTEPIGESTTPAVCAVPQTRANYAGKTGKLFDTADNSEIVVPRTGSAGNVPDFPPVVRPSHR